MSRTSAGLALGFMLGAIVGWVGAHFEVKTECLLQGSFYVGKVVFQCAPKQVLKPQPTLV